MGKYNGGFFCIRNHDRFQHYTSRNPPWIKLHNSILEDYDFGQLEDDVKYHALGLALIASRIDNHIPADGTWVAQRIGARSTVDFKPLLAMGFLAICTCKQCSEQGASKMLAKRYRETERETEGEREGEGETIRSCHADVVSETAKVTQDQIKEVFERHLEARTKFYTRKNGRKPSSLPDLTKDLKRKIRRAIEQHGMEKAKAAGVGIFYSSWHNGEETGKEYLAPHLCWRIQTGDARDVNNVERFSQLVFDKEARFASA